MKKELELEPSSFELKPIDITPENFSMTPQDIERWLSGNQAFPTLCSIIEYEEEDVALALLKDSRLRDVNKEDKEGDSPLHVAIKEKRTKTVKALLSRADLNMNAINRDERTPIETAIEEENEVIARLLLAHPKINFLSTSKISVLNLTLRSEMSNQFIFCMINELWAASKLEEFYNQLSSVLKWEKSKICGLIKHIIEIGHPTHDPLLTVLITHDYYKSVAPGNYSFEEAALELIGSLSTFHTEELRLNTKGMYSNTALIMATFWGIDSIARKLLDNKHIEINHTNAQGHSALMWAARKDMQKTIEKLLLKPHLQVNYAGSAEKKTALMWALEYKKTAVAVQILECNQELKHSPQIDNQTLRLAVGMKQHKIVASLLQRGVHGFDDSSLFKETLRWAIEKNHQELIRLILPEKLMSHQFHIGIADLKALSQYANEIGKEEIHLYLNQLLQEKSQWLSSMFFTRNSEQETMQDLKSSLMLLP